MSVWQHTPTTYSVLGTQNKVQQWVPFLKHIVKKQLHSLTTIWIQRSTLVCGEVSTTSTCMYLPPPKFPSQLVRLEQIILEWLRQPSLTAKGSSRWADKAKPTLLGHPVVSTIADRGRTQAFPAWEYLKLTAQECPAYWTRGRTERELPLFRAGKPRMVEAKCWKRMSMKNTDMIALLLFMDHCIQLKNGFLNRDQLPEFPEEFFLHWAISWVSWHFTLNTMSTIIVGRSLQFTIIIS